MVIGVGWNESLRCSFSGCTSFGRRRRSELIGHILYLGKVIRLCLGSSHVELFSGV